MNKDRCDYKSGLLYFSCLVLCICLFFTTPDGDTIFYKLLGLFGISPGIKWGKNATLYIYMLLPLIAAMVSIKKVLKYWWHYGLRFKEYHVLLRYLPVYIIIPLFFVSSNTMMSPSGIDTLYYAVISQQSGLKSITYHHIPDHNNLSYAFKGHIRTYSYDLTFENHGNEMAEFNVKLTTDGHDGLQEIYVKDDYGEIKMFALFPKQRMHYVGEFTDYYKTEYDGGGGKGIFSVVLINDSECYAPKPISDSR